MKHYLLTLFLFVFFINSSLLGRSKTETTKNTPSEQYKHKITPSPIDGFLENKGQLADSDGNPVDFVLFKIEAPGVDFYLTDEGATYVFKKIRKEPIPEDEWDGRDKMKAQIGKKTTKKHMDWERIDLVLNGASIKKENIVKEYPSPQGHFNYFYPHCPDGIYGVKEYAKITIKEVYPKIDWVLYNNNEKGYKYDFVVHSGANPDDIELIYRSKNKLHINKNGALEINTAYGQLKEEAPKTYLNHQLVNSSFRLEQVQKNIEGGYDNLIRFDLDPTTKNKLQETGNTLIIDPQLVWSTAYGGDCWDGFRDIATDDYNNAFITGYTMSSNFPVQQGNGNFFQGTITGIANDVCILKFNPNGVRLWSTHYGAWGNESANGITVNSNNDILITGYTVSANFPTQNSGTYFQGLVIWNTYDAFILKFDNNGNRLWATYYGGNSYDVAYDITTDKNDNILVCGNTQSTDFPTQNAGTFFQGNLIGPFTDDAFILKFDSNGNRLWATYYGGNFFEYAYNIATDDNNNIFVTGSCIGANFPLQNNGTYYQAPTTLSDDAFILKFDENGNRLWATAYGGGNNDYGSSLLLDHNNNLFVVGYTESTDLPTQNSGNFFQGTYGGGDYDMFILKFDNNGNRLWATYYGGDMKDFTMYSRNRLAVDNCNNLYLSFSTYSTNLLTTPFCTGNFFQNNLNGVANSFLCKFSNNGNLLGASYFGGDGKDFPSGVICDNANNLWMIGEWRNVNSSSSYPLVNPGAGAYYNNAFGGGNYGDCYIAKFNNNGTLTSSSSANSSCNTCNGSATVSVSNLCPPYDYIWDNGAQTLATTNTSNTITNLCPGSYEVTVISNCDTLINVITVNDNSDISIIDTLTLSYCDSMMINNNWYYTSQTVTDTFTNAASNGCDSILVTNLTINRSVKDTFTTSFCDSALINNTWYYTSQTITDTFPNAASNGCDSILTSHVIIASSPTLTITPIFDTIDLGQSIALIASGATNYTWLNDYSTDSILTISPIETTSYCVEGTNLTACKDTLCATIFVKKLAGNIYVPNTFTPNGDGINDVFFVKGINITEFQLEIYNRWGELLFETTDMKEAWDGTYQGNSVQDGIYIWKLKVTTLDEEVYEHVGHVNLLK